MLLNLVVYGCAAILSCMLAGCATNPDGETVGQAAAQYDNTEKGQDAQAKRKIIIDTDCGGDDAVALIMAAKAENIDILGVTVSEGNVSLTQAVDNALMSLEVAGSDMPVYAGANSTYAGKKRNVFSVFGKDGMGDNDMIHPKRKAENGNAVDFIIDTVNANPGEVEIIALGPVTNLALAFDKAPETMKRVKRFWSMGNTDCPDGLVMACAIWDGFIQDIQPCHASVVTDDGETYGQVILYKKGVGYDTGITFDNYDFNVITGVRDNIFKEKLASVL